MIRAALFSAIVLLLGVRANDPSRTSPAPDDVAGSNLPVDELSRCGDCRIDFAKCLVKHKDEDAETKRKNLERCSDEAAICYRGCS